MNRAAIRFVIGQIGDGLAGHADPETGAAAGMIEADRAHGEAPDGGGVGREFVDCANPAERFERDGKLDRVHLAGERGAQPGPGPRGAENPEAAPLRIGGKEEGQALNMIPVRVGNEEGRAQRFFFEFVREIQTEPPDPAARVQNEQLIAEAQLDTGSITAVLHGLGAGGRDRAAHAPEAQEQVRWRHLYRVIRHGKDGPGKGWRIVRRTPSC